jgi:Leucine-rich repeat (LRR) protein
MEVGSFLDRPSLTVCTTQLCWSGVGFVSRPCTDSAKVTTIQLHKVVALCRTASEAPLVDREQANGLATEAIKRIDLYLARRTSARKIVFVVDLTGLRLKNKAFCSDIHRHFQVSSNLQFNNGPSLAVEWHARAKSIDAVTFLLGESLHALDLSYSEVNDISALASCQALHTLHLNDTKVSDVSALASCQALHTLYLDDTPVSDVSALASCQALHTLNLNRTAVSDVSVLASCQALHTLFLNGTLVSDVSALASCQALRTLLLSCTQVSDVSALASCQALHTLYLDVTSVSDVSALASCRALHTLHLDWTKVSDVSALVACGSLRYLQGCQRKVGYEAVARLIENRSLQAQGV